METIEKKYIVNEKNEKIAVQIDIDTFNKIEEILEDYGLAQLMKEVEDDETLTLDEAKKIFQ